jgi:hypothetical protein
VLSPFLLIGQEFGFEGQIFMFVTATAASSGQWAIGNDAILDPAHDFRGSADQDDSGGLQIKHER